jgi:hypothetical protein
MRCNDNGKWPWWRNKVFYWVAAAARSALLATNEFSGVNPQQRITDVPNEWGLYLVEYTTDYELRKLQVSWARTPTAGVVQDADVCTFHFLNLTNGVPDASWITSDYTSVESAFDALWTSLRPNYLPEIKLSEYAWRADGPAFKPFGAGLSPTLRIVPKSVAGSGVGGTALPPQCAMSVTEVTAATYDVSGVGVPGHAPGTGRTQRRNRWGRFYLPAPIAVNLTDGRFATQYCSDVSGFVRTFYNACVTAGIIPVMYSPTTGHAWSVTEVHVDDIVDVVRSRRYTTPLTRAVNAINGP